ncbi:site-specific integrase [Cellvibrio sp. UBA7671]|uniref:site-specific integrase n=1 Tax=Cellvibrio sp. UBA7671 TaxID=1946312 RepID=UPI002F35FFE5
MGINVAYQNSRHRNRLVVIPVVEDAFANLFKDLTPSRSTPVQLELADPKIHLNLERELGAEFHRNVYNMPFLLDAAGAPWKEANGFFLDLIDGQNARKRPTDLARRKAAHLLDYKLFCEKEGLDWLDFSGSRRAHRPTFKYFRHLGDESKISQAVLNQKTATIYQFYNYVASNWHDIDMERVDTCRDIKILVNGSRGNILLETTKRSQTVQRPPTPEVRLGYVREHGEELRPLTNKELNEFLSVLKGSSWSQMERLITTIAITTGARKQTILTLRHRHLQQMIERGPEKNGSYRLHVGPGSGVDTKFGKRQILYFPAHLIHQLAVFAASEYSRVRLNRFRATFHESFPDLDIPREDNTYLFLSERGNCFYMSKEDPRYPFVRSPPIGQITDNIKRKLLKQTSPNFPRDFTFHWLRATFGYLLYQWLLPFLQDGSLKIGEEIELIQRRMHHEHRKTTENYLKLYSGFNEKIFTQEIFESKIFDWGDELFCMSEAWR